LAHHVWSKKSPNQSKAPAIFGPRHLGVEPKNRGKTPQMDGENNGKPENPINPWMIWGKPIIFGNIHFVGSFLWKKKNKKQSSCGPCFYREIHLIQDSAVLKFLPNR